MINRWERKVYFESFYRHSEVLTQLPFELRLEMPPTDRGGRGHSDKYVKKAQRELNSVN